MALIMPLAILFGLPTGGRKVIPLNSSNTSCGMKVGGRRSRVTVSSAALRDAGDGLPFFLVFPAGRLVLFDCIV